LYDDPRVPQLSYAGSDARNFTQAIATLRGQAFQNVQASTFVDPRLGSDEFIQAIGLAASETGPDDTLILFYAGHGVDGRKLGQSATGFALTLPTTRLDMLATTAVPWQRLGNALKQARGTVVVILDACHAGLSGQEFAATNDDAASALFTTARAPIVLLAGSKGRQFAHEDPRTKGGLFTSAIITAIKDRSTTDQDRSGLIDLGELYSSVKLNVMKSSGGKQTPWLARNGLIGEMALF
jgi:uncharacterized caspase-like protein